jgi:AraC family transcriptional regulator
MQRAAVAKSLQSDGKGPRMAADVSLDRHTCRRSSEPGVINQAPLTAQQSTACDCLIPYSTSDLTGILNYIRQEAKRNSQAARAAALQLVALLTPAVSPIRRGGLAPWQKRKIDDHIRQNLKRRMQAKEMAEQVGLSVSHFYRAFKETFGETPFAYAVRLRVELAQRCMLTTDDPLSHIALACGFADLSQLSKLFRRHVGESPTAWRRRRLTNAHVEEIRRRSAGS